jgi:dephospho-CoA kinase
MCGSGKSIACDTLKELNWFYVRFGQITIDKLKEGGEAITPENEQRIRENLRKKYGMGAYALLSLPRLEDSLNQGNVVIDGLYSWSEYKILKARFNEQLQVIHIYASPGTRYQRLAERSHTIDDKEHRMRKLSPEEARKRDYAEIENIEKGGPIAMADYTIINEESFLHLKEKIVELATQNSL